MTDSPSSVSELELALKESLGITSLALHRSKMTRDEYLQLLEHNPAIKEEIQDYVLDFVEGKLFSKIKEGDTHAITYYLNEKGKRRGYGKR